MDDMFPLPCTTEKLSQNIPEVILIHQFPFHTRTPTDLITSTAVNHNVTPRFIASNK